MNLDEYRNTKLPSDWTVTKVLDDVIMAEFVDTDESGDNVKRDGVFIPIDVSKSLWRVGKVLLLGPKCSDQIKIGSYICWPNDKGIRALSVDGKVKYVFINEVRVFGVVEKIKTDTKSK